MTTTYTKNGMATLDRTAEATLTPLPRAAAHGVRIEVNELCRRRRAGRSRHSWTQCRSRSRSVS